MAEQSAGRSTGDHVWVVDSLDQQYGFAAPGEQERTSLWIATARCTQCGLRVEFRATDVGPCVPRSTPRAPGPR